MGEAIWPPGFLVSTTNRFYEVPAMGPALHLAHCGGGCRVMGEAPCLFQPLCSPHPTSLLVTTGRERPPPSVQNRLTGLPASRICGFFSPSCLVRGSGSCRAAVFPSRTCE